MVPHKDALSHLLYVKLDNQKTCIQSFKKKIWYPSLIKLNWCIHLHNAIHTIEAILMHACIKNWKSPCHKQNPN
jgi:hypothetical protein